jgi:hypothetical protein
MESENIEEVIQEGGAVLGTDPNDTVRTSSGNKTIQLLWNTANKFSSLVEPPGNSLLKNFTLTGVSGTITDRPLLLSDLASLMVTGRPSNIPVRTNIQNLFDNIPLAQYKHLPDISVLAMGGGSERTLETQEVSLPSEQNEEDLPSLDIVEPSSIGGSYKRSSHKKRKSTRIRTKKNKKL